MNLRGILLIKSSSSHAPWLVIIIISPLLRAGRYKMWLRRTRAGGFVDLASHLIRGFYPPIPFSPFSPSLYIASVSREWPFMHLSVPHTHTHTSC